MYLLSRFRVKPVGWFLILIVTLPFFKDIFLYTFLYISKNLTYLYNYDSQTASLKKRNLALVLQINKLRYLEEENKKLRKALKLKDEVGEDLMYTKVWGFSPSSWRRIAFINLGKDDGIEQDMLVVDAGGFLVGKMLQVFDGYSTIILLNDPYFSLPVFIENKGMGLLRGTLRGDLNILYIEDEQKVALGDRVWVSSKKSSFPIYVGKITKIKRDSGDFFLKVTAQGFTSSSSIREVFLIK